MLTGSTPWLIKFQSASEKPKQPIQEFIAAEVAREAGVEMPRTHLFRAGMHICFGIERFDRTPEGKVHMCTVAGLLGVDFRMALIDYERLMGLAWWLSQSREAMVALFRRAALNVMISNHDDHLKNFAFLMDADGRWRLSPGYDITPSGETMLGHTTSVLGKLQYRAAGLYGPCPSFRHAKEDRHSSA